MVSWQKFPNIFRWIAAVIINIHFSLSLALTSIIINIQIFHRQSSIKLYGECHLMIICQWHKGNKNVCICSNNHYWIGTVGLNSMSNSSCICLVLVAQYKLVNTNSIQKPRVFTTCNCNGYF